MSGRLSLERSAKCGPFRFLPVSIHRWAHRALAETSDYPHG